MSINRILRILFFLGISAPAFAYQGGTLKNHAHTVAAGDGGGLSLTTQLNSFNLVSFLKYRRPNLIWQSTNTVTLDSGTVTGVVGDMSILFPDNALLTVNNTNYTTLDLRQVAVRSGSAKAGMWTGSPANNGLLAVYAAKLTDFTTNYVLVADTMAPVASNLTALNGEYGANGWVYLGILTMDANSAILQFIQNGSLTVLDNSATSQGKSVIGKNLANTGSAATLTWSYATGTAGAVVFPNMSIGLIGMMSIPGAQGDFKFSSGASGTLWELNEASNALSVINTGPFPIRMSSGVSCAGAASSAFSIQLEGWYDNALTPVSTPQF